MSPAAATPLGSALVHPAVRRAPATVALDLRRAGHAAAVAVDRRGAVSAWAVLAADDGDRVAPVALARRALRELRVRPTAVRVLVGAGAGAGGGAQAALLSQPAAPGAAEIAAALYAEGFQRLHEPAAAALAVAAETWLVAACEDGTVASLAAGLLAESEAEPVFIVDQQLAAAGLAPGTALIELGAAGLLMAVNPPGGPLFVRALPEVQDVEEAARECRESLTAAGGGAGVAIEICGQDAALLARRLAAGEAAAAGGVPAACDLARRLALRREPPPPLASPRLARLHGSLAWARRAARAGLLLAAAGLLLMVLGLRLAWAGRTGGLALRARLGADARMVRDLRRLGALAEEVGRLRSSLAGTTPPWPRLAAAVADLARRLPPRVGWQRLEIQDGALEIAAAAATAAGESPQDGLALLRRDLERAPDLVNLSWQAAGGPPETAHRRQLFRATLRALPVPAAAAPVREAP